MLMGETQPLGTGAGDKDMLKHQGTACHAKGLVFMLERDLCGHVPKLPSRLT
jgi:hypothetical protein